MKKLILILVAAVMMVGITNAAVQEGLNEITFSGAYTNTNIAGAGRTETTTVDIGWGNFVSDQWQWGIRGGYDRNEAAHVYRVGLFTNWHFSTGGQIIPYIGGQIALNHVDPRNGGDRTTGYLWGPQAGVKMFINRDAALVLEYQWREFEGGGSRDIHDQQVILGGIAAYF